MFLASHARIYHCDDSEIDCVRALQNDINIELEKKTTEKNTFY